MSHRPDRARPIATVTPGEPHPMDFAGRPSSSILANWRRISASSVRGMRRCFTGESYQNYLSPLAKFLLSKEQVVDDDRGFLRPFLTIDDVPIHPIEIVRTI